ncbi:MAG: aminotransferase class IV [Asticcacaulis sp.]
MIAGCKDILVANKLKGAYWRPVAFLGENGMGVTPKGDAIKVDLAIARLRLGRLSRRGRPQQGSRRLRVVVAARAPNTIPNAAKMGGNYLSSYLIGKEARGRGYAEGIGLGTDGRLSEGAGENLFLMMGGKIHTPRWHRRSWAASPAIRSSTGESRWHRGHRAGPAARNAVPGRRSPSCAARRPKSRRSAASTTFRPAPTARARSPSACNLCSMACSTARPKTASAGWNRSRKRCRRNN